MTKKVKIKIIKQDQWGKFNIGDIGEMNVEGAKRYVDAGFAEYLEEKNQKQKVIKNTREEKENFEENIKEKTKSKIKERKEQKLAFLDFEDLSVENQAIRIIDNNPLFYDKIKRWWAFDKLKKQWKAVDEVDLIGFVKKNYKRYGLSDPKQRTSLVNALKDEARLRKPLELNEFQIQIGKYIYDIRNDNIIEASHKYAPDIIIDHDIDTVTDDEDFTNLKKLFVDWQGEYYNVLIDIIAYCISPKYFLDILFWFVGSGENGKGLFTTVINKVIGFENTTSQDIELLSDPKDRFTKAFLNNKLVCNLGDGNPQVIEHTKALKTLSGSTDRIRGEIKGGGQIDFFNRAKLIGSFNTLPETSDKTNGFYRRQHITEFKNNFCGLKNPLPDIPEREYTVLTARCFLRLKEIYKENTLIGWGNIEDRKEKYERLSNPVGLFINDKLEDDHDYYAFGKTLYNKYVSFALEKGFNTFNLKDFEARLVNQGYEKKRKDVYVYGDMCWGKKNTIPSDINVDDCEFSKFSVFCGLKFKKIDKIDEIDAVSKLKVLHEKINSKSESISSILSISNKENSDKPILTYKLLSELPSFSYEELRKKYDFSDAQFDNYINKLVENGDFVQINPNKWVKNG